MNLGLTTLRQGQNGRHFADDILDAFFQWKLLQFNSNVNELYSTGSSPQYAITGLDNSLAPNGWQASNWTNDDQIQWRMYASPGFCMLTPSVN